MLTLYTKKYMTTKYTCVDFVQDAWKQLFDLDISSKLKLNFSAGDRHHFKRLDRPSSPCIVLMSGKEHHVGIYYRNKVLHLTKTGVEYTRLEVASRGFKTVKYYVCDYNR